MKILAVTLLLMYANLPMLANAAVGHHGQLIVHCEPPHFFEEAPGKDAKVSTLERFSVFASDNTDPASLKLWVNNRPVEPKITQEHNGGYRAEGQLPPGVTGKIWLKVTADSHDGCDDYLSWFVYSGN